LLNTCAFFGVGALVSSLVRLPLPVSLFGFDSSVTPSMQPDPAASSSLYVAGAVSWYANQQAFLPWLVLGVSMSLLLLAIFVPASSEQSPSTAATASTVLKIEAADAAASSPVAELKQEGQADSSSAASGAAPVSVAEVSASSSSTEASSDFMSTTTREVLVSFCSALIFGTGLCFAGMTDPHRVASFLDFNPAHGWNPQLMLVLGAGVAVNLVAFRFILARQAPVLCSAFSVPNRTDITARLLMGGSFFGVGWGMCGICPGPGMVAIGSGRVGFPIFMCACIIGMYAYVLMEKVLAMNA
jgi:hypothetical protein